MLLSIIHNGIILDLVCGVCSLSGRSVLFSLPFLQLGSCDTGTSGQRRSDGNIELVRFLDIHEGDRARAVFARVQLLYRNNTPHDNPSKFAHR